MRGVCFERIMAVLMDFKVTSSIDHSASSVSQDTSRSFALLGMTRK